MRIIIPIIYLYRYQVIIGSDSFILYSLDYIARISMLNLAVGREFEYRYRTHFKESISMRSNGSVSMSSKWLVRHMVIKNVWPI